MYLCDKRFLFYFHSWNCPWIHMMMSITSIYIYLFPFWYSLTYIFMHNAFIGCNWIINNNNLFFIAQGISSLHTLILMTEVFYHFSSNISKIIFRIKDRGLNFNEILANNFLACHSLSCFTCKKKIFIVLKEFIHGLFFLPHSFSFLFLFKIFINEINTNVSHIIYLCVKLHPHARMTDLLKAFEIFI